MTSPDQVRAPDEVLLGFARALRSSGVAVTQDRAQGFLDAVACVGLYDASATHAAGRATLCGSPDDLVRFDQVFEAYFNPHDGLPRAVPSPPAAPTFSDLPESDGDSGAGTDTDDQMVQALASDTDVLRQRDIASLSAAEKHRLASMFATLRPRPPKRRTARHQRWHRGDVDAARTLRSSLRRMGEPGEIQWRRRGVRPRRMVLLVDVSGSMSGYADALLRLSHRMVTAVPGRHSVEVFTVGTRLTHLTRALSSRDAERALIAAGQTVPDWSGGTRLGETLAIFLDRWGRRGMARGAVVVVFSDGWERGDASLLAEQMARLRRVAHRVVWVNPHRGKVGYEPVQQGVVAVLPYIDDFLAGHSLATYAELMEVLARA